MNNSTVNFTTFGASTNSTTLYFGIMSILDIFNLLFGCPTHSYVLWLIVTGTGRGVASELFMLNLSVCEIGNCLNSLLSLFDYHPVIKKITECIIGMAITGRPLFQCLICVERYLAVVHPVIFLKYKPLRYRVICCAVVWIITLGSCFSFMFIIVSCNFYIFVCCFSLQFLIFLSSQLFFLVAVLRALKQSGPGDRGRERVKTNHMKRRAFYLILITTVSMIITYVPYIITGLHSILTLDYFQEPFTVAFLCYILAGFVQPVLYLNRVGKLFCLQ